MHTRSSQIQVLLEVEVISNKIWQCICVEKFRFKKNKRRNAQQQS